MQFTVKTKTFLSAVLKAGKTVNRKSPLAIMQSLRVTVADGNLAIAVTDGNTFLQTAVEVSGLIPPSDGACCIDYRTAVELLRKISAPEFVLTSDNAEAVITAGRGSFKLPVLNALEFPERDNFTPTAGFTVPARMLAEGINGTVFAAADESTLHKVLAGVYMVFRQNSIDFAASDSYVFALKSFPMDIPGNAGELPPGIIVPVKAARIMAQFLTADEAVHISTDGKSVRIETPGVVIVSTLALGTYPNYARIINVEAKTTCMLERERLMKSISRMSVFSSATDNRMTAHITPGTLVLETGSPEYGSSACETVSCETSGHTCRISFKWQNVADILDNFDSTEVTMTFADNTKPFLVTGDDLRGAETKFLVMPMLK